MLKYNYQSETRQNQKELNRTFKSIKDTFVFKFYKTYFAKSTQSKRTTLKNFSKFMIHLTPCNSLFDNM